MHRIRGFAFAVAMGAGLMANGALAQNVGNNSGIWWTAAPGQPASFTFLNPLTTMYLRLGMFRAFQTNSGFGSSDAFALPAGTTFDGSDAWGAVLGMGARLMPVLRYELQMSGTINTVAHVLAPGLDTWTIRHGSVQLMNNFYLDIAPFFANGLWGFNPYVMAGIGVSWNRTSDQSLVDGGVNPFAGNGTGSTRTNFAWNAGAGVQWQPMRHVILDLGYRYLDAGHYQTRFVDGGGPAAAFGFRFDNRSHQVMFSVIVSVDGLIRGFGN